MSPFNPSLFPFIPKQPLICFHSWQISLYFLDLRKWNHRAYTFLLFLASFTPQKDFEIHPKSQYVVSVVHSQLLLNSIPHIDIPQFGFFVYLSMHGCVVSGFWLLQIKLLCSVVYMFLCRHMFLFFLGKYLGLTISY